MSTNSRILRYFAGERVNHWLTAITFIMLAFSGLALFHPAAFGLTQLFGGPVWTRILHPFLGLFLFLSFTSLALRLWRHNLLTADDLAWLLRLKLVLRNQEEGLPKVGRYNAGQKLLFWTMVLTIGFLLVTGIVIWRPWFADYFPIEIIRFSALIHALSAALIITGIIVHIYAAIWIRGTLGAMIHGTVSQNWARKHHPLWFDQIDRKMKD